MNRVSGKRGAALRVQIGLLVLLMAGLPAMAKVEVDFNPNLDFFPIQNICLYRWCGASSDVAVES